MSESRIPNEAITDLAVSRDGKAVFIDEDNTNIHLHIVENPNLLGLIKEVIEQSALEGDNVAIEHDMGRVIGTTSCVLTDDSDDIVYAKRKQRDSYSRFVKNKDLEDTRYVTVILHKIDERYRLWSGWCGRLVPTVPDQIGQPRGDKAFWDNHALVYDPQILQLDTITNKKPW